MTDRPLRESAADAWEGLTSANKPTFLFRRGRLMVDVVQDDQGHPILRVVDRPTLKGYLDRIADFVKRTDQGEKPAGRRPTWWPRASMASIVACLVQPSSKNRMSGCHW